MAARVRNSGRTPAMNVKIALTTVTASGPVSAAAEVEECKTCPQVVLLPNAAVTSDIDGGVLDASGVVRLKSGEDTISLTGRIDYMDSLAHPHTTRVCMIYTAKTSTFSTCPDGNRID